MADYIPDPELNELVREINEGGASSVAAEETFESFGEPSREIGEGHPLERLLRGMMRRAASDLLLIPDSPPVFRIHGALTRIEGESFDAGAIRTMFLPHVPDLDDRLDRQGAVDFSLHLAGDDAGRAPHLRVRINLHRQRGRIAAAIRALPAAVPSLEQLHLPASLASLVRPMQGLVLVCGPTGSGKSSTLAALVGQINASRACHIVTIEDPVEYEHLPQQSVIEQIEIGRDAPSFASALRSILRQDPDVILVGEMRDLETMSTAISAAETGHLILSTLHTADAAQAAYRMIDAFPANQQGQIRQQLALSLHAIVCQQLVPRADGKGRVPAVEVLIANQPVRNHIRGDRLQNIVSEITLGKRIGMISLEESLASLVRAGLISREEAELRARRPDELASHLG